jgi:CHAD domain-containing protein
VTLGHLRLKALLCSIPYGIWPIVSHFPYVLRRPPNPMKAHTNDYDRLLAAQFLRKQLKQLINQFKGIRRAETVEAVHRARVAIRRLRAALAMFRDCFSGKTIKRWRKQLRQVAKELGDARDKDVQIEFLTGVLSSLDDQAQLPGIARLLVCLELDREALQSQVVEALDRLQASGILEEMNAKAKALMPKSDGPNDDAQSRVLFRQLGEHILDRVEELLAHQESLSRPDDQETHHAMRIAAKHLRYTMEICRPAYEGRLDEFLTAVKEVQSLLGEIHDCDVWVEQLDAFLESQRKRMIKCYGHDVPLARVQPGIHYLCEERQRQRGELFERLVTYWQELERQKTWSRLMQVVYAPADTRPDLLRRLNDGDDRPPAAAPLASEEPSEPTPEPNGADRQRGEHAEGGRPTEYPSSTAGSQ